MFKFFVVSLKDAQVKISLYDFQIANVFDDDSNESTISKRNNLWFDLNFQISIKKQNFE